MTLRDFLLNETRVGDLVLIREDGWQIGCSMPDWKEYFLKGIIPDILERTVASSVVTERDWIDRRVVIVEIL